jgi:hypothetical protein
MNSGGNVRWRTQVPRPVIALEVDPLGNYLIYGHSTGEIIRLDLFGEGREPRKAARPLGGAKPAAGSGITSSPAAIKTAEWMVPVVDMDQQAETAVMSVQTDPPLIALFTSPHRLRLYDLTGRKIGVAPDMVGVGRILRTAPGWIAAATDRQIVLCDLREEEYRKLDVSLVQLTHLAIRPHDFGLGIVEERDRIGRLTIAGRWVWKRELKLPVEEMAVGPGGLMAVTTNAGELMVFDPAGEPTIAFRFDPTDAPIIIEAPDSSPFPVAWLTLARRSQWMRGHDARGQVVWERPMPWEGWALSRLGRVVVASSADGQALTCDGAGNFREQSGPTTDANDLFSLDADGAPVRITRRGVHLICASLDGRVRWRAIVEPPVGPIAADRPGIAVLLGKSLAWFKNEPGARMPEV